MDKLNIDKILGPAKDFILEENISNESLESLTKFIDSLKIAIFLVTPHNADYDFVSVMRYRIQDYKFGPAHLYTSMLGREIVTRRNSTGPINAGSRQDLIYSGVQGQHPVIPGATFIETRLASNQLTERWNATSKTTQELFDLIQQELEPTGYKLVRVNNVSTT